MKNLFGITALLVLLVSCDNSILKENICSSGTVDVGIEGSYSLNLMGQETTVEIKSVGTGEYQLSMDDELEEDQSIMTCVIDGKIYAGTTGSQEVNSEVMKFEPTSTGFILSSVLFDTNELSALGVPFTVATNDFGSMLTMVDNSNVDSAHLLQAESVQGDPITFNLVKQ